MADLDLKEDPSLMVTDDVEVMGTPNQQSVPQEGANASLAIDVDAENEKHWFRWLQEFVDVEFADDFLRLKYAESFNKLSTITICNRKLAKELDQVNRTVLGGNCSLEYLFERNEESWAGLMQQAVTEIEGTYSDLLAVSKKLPDVQKYRNLFRKELVARAWKDVGEARGNEKLREAAVKDVKEYLHRQGRAYVE